MQGTKEKHKDWGGRVKEVGSEDYLRGRSLAGLASFDLLHAGYVYSLSQASKLGDHLWVALNSDSSIKRIKGLDRPIVNEIERAFMLKSLSFVQLEMF